MNVSLHRLQNENWELHPDSQPIEDPLVNLVLCFGSKFNLAKPNLFKTVQSKFPNATIAFCSTAGEIYQQMVLDDSLIVTAIQLEKTKINSYAVNIGDYSNTYTAAIDLAKKFSTEGLRYVLVLSDGSRVNGSDLVKGLSTQIGKNVLITGALAGDGVNFHSTLVGLNDQPREGEILAVGFYGSDFHVTHSSQGGWEIFGLEKRVTNASANILSELEGQNALDLYKRYLGADADKLPSAALLYPLSVVIPGTEKPVVRTILSINEDAKTMTFAGDIPVGSSVRFMKANFDKLTLAAHEAAEHTKTEGVTPRFSLLISCVGRKLVLGDKIVEEVKAVSKAFKDQTLLAGFYSYGELSPFNEGGYCQLHNQTMTITSFYEV